MGRAVFSFKRCIFILFTCYAIAGKLLQNLLLRQNTSARLYDRTPCGGGDDRRLCRPRWLAVFLSTMTECTFDRFYPPGLGGPVGLERGPLPLQTFPCGTGSGWGPPKFLATVYCLNSSRTQGGGPTRPKCNPLWLECSVWKSTQFNTASSPVFICCIKSVFPRFYSLVSYHLAIMSVYRVCVTWQRITRCFSTFVCLGMFWSQHTAS